MFYATTNSIIIPIVKKTTYSEKQNFACYVVARYRYMQRNRISSYTVTLTEKSIRSGSGMANQA